MFNRPKFSLSIFSAIAIPVLVLTGTSAIGAETSTECTAGSFCYCVSSDLKDLIAKRVAYIRTLIRGQKGREKAVGYMSIPLSSLEGSYLPVNEKIAAEVKARLEERFGGSSVWVLNPAAKDVALPKGATGADYMLMWTRVLEGDDGFGRDFDFVYFVGPSDFARHFLLNGHDDMKKIDAYYERLSKKDVGLTSVNKVLFRKYYGLRASVAFSYGAHDEWNIVRSVNEKRRSANPKLGIADQLGIFFDGQAVAPGMFEAPVAAGDAGRCEQK